MDHLPEPVRQRKVRETRFVCENAEALGGESVLIGLSSLHRGGRAKWSSPNVSEMTELYAKNDLNYTTSMWRYMAPRDGTRYRAAFLSKGKRCPRLTKCKHILRRRVTQSQQRPLVL
jgi:hypothetical protein